MTNKLANRPANRQTNTGLYVNSRRVDGRKDSLDYIIDVVDEHGNLILWGGPYSRTDVLDARDVFENGKVDLNDQGVSYLPAERRQENERRKHQHRRDGIGKRPAAEHAAYGYRAAGS